MTTPGSPPDGAEPRSGASAGLAGRLARSTGAATLSQVWRFGVTFGTHMVLRRLLPEGDWGLWHWSVDWVFLLLAQVRDLGLPAQVVRDRDRPYGNFLAVEAVWGAALALAMVAAGPLVALAYREPDPNAVPVLRALCLFLVFEGLGKVPHLYFEAELQIERALAPELLRNACFAALAISLALAGYGIWAMVIAHVAASGLFAALLWWRAWGRVPLRWKPGGTLPLVRLSLPLMVMALALLAVDWVDAQVVGGRFPSDVLGLYGGALTLALLVPRVLELPVRRALYPGFVEVRDDRPRFFETYRLATVLLMAVNVPFALFLFVNAEIILTVAWSAEYVEAAPFLRSLCFIPLVQPFVRCAEDVILTLHRERVLIVASLVTLASYVGFGLWLTSVAGPVGMAWAKLLPLGAALVTWVIYRIDPPGFRRLLGDLALLYLVPVPLFAAAWWVGAGSPWLRVGLSVVAGLLTAVVYVRLHGRAFKRFFREIA